MLDHLKDSLAQACEDNDLESILEICGEIEFDYPDFDLDAYLLELGWRV